MVGTVIGVSGLGVLANEVSLDVQKLGVFPSITSFDGGFSCSCDGFACSFEEGSHAEMICNWEAHLIGFIPPPPEYYGEGCSANFWSTNSGYDSNQSLWPPGYDPDYNYNDIFSTTYFYDDVYSQEGIISVDLETKHEIIYKLEALKEGADKKTVGKINKAIKSIEESLKSSYWIDDTTIDKKHAKKVFENKEKAVKELMKIRSSFNDAQLQEIIDFIVKDARDMAIISINVGQSYFMSMDSEEYNGDEDSKKDDKKTDKEMKKAIEGVKKANKEMEKANKELLNNKFDKVIKHYGQAWKHSQAGMGKATEYDHLYGPTLQEVLEIQGVGYDSFIRESVAALLNAASDDVKYKYSVPEVIEMTQKAIASGDYSYAQEEFVEYNNDHPGLLLCPVP